MNTKLTLKLDEGIIERAKLYAKDHEISLSKMIESYLDSLTRKKSYKKEIEITPFVKSLSTGVKIPADFDYKKEIKDALWEKYK